MRQHKCPNLHVSRQSRYGQMLNRWNYSLRRQTNIWCHFKMTAVVTYCCEWWIHLGRGHSQIFGVQTVNCSRDSFRCVHITQDYIEPSVILLIYTFILVDRTQWAYRMQNHVLPPNGEHYIHENSISVLELHTFKCFWCTTLRARIPLRYTCVKQVAFAEFICPKCAILFLSSIQSQSETHFVSDL